MREPGVQEVWRVVAMGLLKCWDEGSVVVLTLSVSRGRGREQAAHGGDPP